MRLCVTFFIDLALENSDIAHIMHTASTLINHQIYFIDHRKFQLYPANNKLQQQLKEMDSSHWAKRKVRLVRIHEQGYFVYSVLNGEVVIGYLFIETTQVPIDTELVVIEQTGVVMALKISNHRSMEEILNRQRQELVSQLLRQQPLQRIQGRAQALGLILHEPVMVILMQMRKQIGVLYYEKLGVNQLFMKQDPEAITQFLTQTLAPFKRHVHRLVS